MKCLICILIGLGFLVPLCSQEYSDFGIKLQAYPTGFIPGITFETSLGGGSAMEFRLGYNVVRHGDAGVHEDERGGGFGFSFAYKRYFRVKHRWQGVLRTDLWFNEVDWKDQIGTGREENGTTRVKVLQPTVEAGYTFLTGAGWFFIPALALGAEINVTTKGAGVGEGLILLGGITFGKRL
jgi:hypothetical protein